MHRILSTKIAVIGGIALLLLIPLILISGKISERLNYFYVATQSVAVSWTGKQQLVGPIVVIPYEVERKVEVWNKETRISSTEVTKVARTKFVLPQRLKIEASIANDVRYKGIYKVPVYTSRLKLSGELDLKLLRSVMAEIRKVSDLISIGDIYLVTMVSDPRGINSIPTLNWSGEFLPFEPGSELVANRGGIHAYLPDPDQMDTDTVEFSFELELRGMETLSFVPVGQEAIVNVSSSWPHPEFAGKFLPVSRTIDASGYEATWKITSFASNIAEKIRRCEVGSCGELLSGGFGVSHIEPVDIYLQSERSVKYGFLFIGLTFVTFFIFEVVKKLPIHAIQYTLVGCAIAIFFLLLISLSEHINFALSYAIATFCCVSLLLYYLRYVLGGYKEATAFSALLLALYGVLYVIISAEDFAFLMGGFLTFSTLVIVMVSTRNIDWYSVGGTLNSDEAG